MALYHFHVSQVSRGKGQSCLASDAYITGTRLIDDYYGDVHDYTKKHGVLFTELLLPDYAPERLHDREVLFNELEVIEKHPKAQLCYSFDFSLQNELSYEENLEIAQKFIKENFLSKGMIVDYAIHDPDKHGGIPNPHVHMIIPIRPLNEDGTWGEKQKREYLIDENGERIKKPNGKYDFKSVPTTDWGASETLDAWSNKAKVKNIKERAAVIFFLSQNNISTFEELKDFVHASYGKVNELQEDISEIDKKISKIKDAFRYRQMLAETKPIYDKQFSFRLKRNQEKYVAEHRDALDKYHSAKRMLDNYWYGRKPNWEVAKINLNNLEKTKSQKQQLYKDCKVIASEAYKIRKIAEEMIKKPATNIPVHQVTKKRKYELGR